jgi:hypothetical protein
MVDGKIRFTVAAAELFVLTSAPAKAVALRAAHPVATSEVTGPEFGSVEWR